MASVALEYMPPSKNYPSPLAIYSIDRENMPRYATYSEVEVQLPLRAGIKMRFVPDKTGGLPADFVEVIEAIREIEVLRPGWDSYGAFPLNDRAVSPAIDLALAGIGRGQKPRIVPLPTGGLGLRWVSDAAELEIDVGPDGSASALFENHATGAEEERSPTGVEQLVPLVHQFCQIN